MHQQHKDPGAAGPGNRRTVSHSAWIEHGPSPQKPGLQLFCFPYAGGSAQIFRSWQRYMPPEIDLCLINLPGRGKRMREPLFTRLLPLVKSIADAMVREVRHPFALFGHSMGAVISFEVARELRRRQSIGPVHLFISGRSAPQISDTGAINFDLPHDEFIDELRKLNGTPRELLENPDLMQLVLPVIRADFELVDTYEYAPGKPLSCPITAYGGLQDTDIPTEELYAWKEQTSSTFVAKMLPGDHFFVNTPIFRSTLAGDLAGLVHKSST